MSRSPAGMDDLSSLLERSYRHGFITDIDADTVPPGLDESVVRLISRKKNEPQFLLDWRLRALQAAVRQSLRRWAARVARRS